MKWVVLNTILFLLVFTEIYAQPPQSLKYQAVVRDNSGNILPDHTIGLRISILDNSPSGTVLYTETFATTSNPFGLFSINIGTGSVITGVFSLINWAVDTKWLQVEIDNNGGSNYSLIGTSQFLSVPYALYAEKSGFAYNQNLTYSTLGDTVFMGNTYIIVPGVSMANACRMDFVDNILYTIDYPHASENPYNSALYGLPKFILKNYIELDKIDSISRYRSGVGHDYSDSYESCRSMKHYFKPKNEADWASVKIFSPVNGVVNNSFTESIGGNQVWITPFGMPAFNVSIFHINLTVPLNVGDTVWSGQQLGTHTGPQTTSDIAIQINAPNGTFQRVSYFDVMTDKLFACYMSRGLLTRDSLTIPKADRDADPLFPCNGSQFFVTGTINNWVTLY